MLSCTTRTRPGTSRSARSQEPEPGRSEVLIRVAATSLNFADVAFLRERQAGRRRAGVRRIGGRRRRGRRRVRTAARRPGGHVRLVRRVGGAARAVDVGELAVVPDEVELAAAAAVPVAGVTALRALRRLGSVVGRRVLITGASGGVGRFAVQLAAQAGAHVVAAVGSPARGEGLDDVGCRRGGRRPRRRSPSPSYGALDNVGGRTLAEVVRAAGAGRLRAERRDGLAGADHDRLRAGPPARRWPHRGVHRRARLRPRPRLPDRAGRCRPSSTHKSIGAARGTRSLTPPPPCWGARCGARRCWRCRREPAGRPASRRDRRHQRDGTGRPSARPPRWEPTSSSPGGARSPTVRRSPAPVKWTSTSPTKSRHGDCSNRSANSTTCW